MGSALARILSQGEVEVFMLDPKINKVATKITNNHMNAIEKVVDEYSLLAMINMNGIPHGSYNKMIQILKSGIWQVDKKLNFKSMPTPFWVSLVIERGPSFAWFHYD